MIDMQPLLIELGTEELPVKALPGLAQAFYGGVIDALGKRGIAVNRGDARPLYSPRRLAAILPGVATEQPEQRSEVFGPYLKIALDADGQPTRALQGFAQKAGVDWSELERATDAKGERFVHRSVKPGAKTADLLPEVLREAIAAMPIPKPMRWGDHDHAFARPVHWLVLLLGDAVVEAEVFGVSADRMSRGHRFLHDKTVWVARPDDYVDALRGAKVLVDPDERRARIVEQVEAAAKSAGGNARIDDDNLAQVNCLVEWPSAVACSFDPGFLAVPQEVLVATMETNQKFFPVLDDAGGLTEHFIGVANIAPSNDSEIRKGYERVIRPRFADARFFFAEDKKQGLASMNDGLANVTYQAKLGSVADKVQRVAALAEAIAPELDVDPKLARRAAELSKADLQSRLVNEFPELQGIAGRHYAMQDAALDALPHDDRAALANAIDEAYRPRFAGDDIALSPLGKTLAIAERLDTLAGGFAAGLKPTGNKDPFALRRNALGLARTIIESGLGTNDWALVRRASLLALTSAQNRSIQNTEFDRIAREHSDVSKYGWVRRSTRNAKPSISVAEITEDTVTDLAGEIYDFVVDRLSTYYQDAGRSVQEFEAVAHTLPSSFYDFDRRLDAIGSFAALPEAEALAAANKRINNILKKADGVVGDTVDTSLLQEPAERALAEVIEAVYAETHDGLARGDYADVLTHLARLRPQVDAFFDAVMVNADDEALRNNRLALLKRLSDRLGSVAAIEHLSV